MCRTLPANEPPLNGSIAGSAMQHLNRVQNNCVDHSMAAAGAGAGPGAGAVAGAGMAH